MPGVKVTVQNQAARDDLTVTTSSSSDDVINLPQQGRYVITVEAPNFKRATVNLSVSAGDRARAEAQPRVGEVDVLQL